jgi:hypothetical protein
MIVNAHPFNEKIVVLDHIKGAQIVKSRVEKEA